MISRERASATSAGKIVGSTTLDSLTPSIVDAGGIAYGALYFDTILADDSTVEFSFKSDAIKGCSAAPAFIDEVNLVPGSYGNNLVGKVRAPADQKISGPISLDLARI